MRQHECIHVNSSNLLVTRSLLRGQCSSVVRQAGGQGAGCAVLQGQYPWPVVAGLLPPMGTGPVSTGRLQAVQLYIINFRNMSKNKAIVDQPYAGSKGDYGWVRQRLDGGGE